MAWRGANSPRLELFSLGSRCCPQSSSPKGCLAGHNNAAVGQLARSGVNGTARLRRAAQHPPPMATGRCFQGCLLAAIATAAADPRFGAEERGLVTRLNRRYRGGLCFKAFIRWPKQGRERARGRAEMDFHAIDAASAHWLMPHRFASAPSKSGWSRRARAGSPVRSRA